MSHDFSIVVSLHKAGTNLLTRLVREMGYAPIGSGVRESYAGIYEMIETSAMDDTRRRYGSRPQDILADSETLLELCLSAAKPGTSIFLHSAPSRERLQSLLRDRIPVVFNYRDPRAVLVSFVHYLMQAANEEFTETSGYTELSTVLRRLPTIEARLLFVMRHLPKYLTGVFADNAWLLDEGAVTKVSYEELVGPRGGGSSESQQLAIARVMRALGSDMDASAVVRSAYSEQSRTFRKGRIAGWRDDFTPGVSERFMSQYDNLLKRYAYEV